jgi:hypothetical protein
VGVPAGVPPPVGARATAPRGCTALPPTAVLRRGSGSGLERMYVFLALLQQLDLDGLPDRPAERRPAPARVAVPTADKKGLVTGAPRGPFWAAGVRVGADVKLFDPWRGARDPVHLNQLRADPGAAKGWFADPANVGGVTPKTSRRRSRPLFSPSGERAGAADGRGRRAPEGRAGRAAVVLGGDAEGRVPRTPKPAFWNPPERPAAPAAWSLRAGGPAVPAVRPRRGRPRPGRRRLYDLYRREQLPAGGRSGCPRRSPRPGPPAARGGRRGACSGCRSSSRRTRASGSSAAASRTPPASW